MKKLFYSLFSILFAVSVHGQFTNEDMMLNKTTTAGTYNQESIILGHATQPVTVTAKKNVAVGVLALDALNTGNAITAIGYKALSNLAYGQYNVAVGSNAGLLMNNNAGSSAVQNVVVGHNAGSVMKGGKNNVYIGAGAKSETGDTEPYYRIAIGQSVTTTENNTAIIGKAYDASGATPVGITAIYFGGATGTATMTGKSLILENGETIANAVDGTITVSGNITVSSDLRLKDNIETLGRTLSELSKLDGKSYERNGVKQIGLLAQDVQTVYPELVVEDADGMLAVDYQALVPVLINAVKEQEDKISRLENLVNQLLNK